MSHEIVKNIDPIDYPDATPTYRGYRRQALYVLHRILRADANASLQPEYLEDLAVHSADGKLRELVQVKDYSHPLQLSDFDPAGKRSFFSRCADSIDAHPEIELRLATYGNVGPELRDAIERDGTGRDSVANKIAKHGQVDEVSARRILSRLEIEECREASLLDTINTTLMGMVTSLNPSEAFDALNFWVFQCSEKQQKITREDLSMRVTRIGQFIADMASHHAEWLSTIMPIDDTYVESCHLSQLREEFHSGVAARYEHILAQLDVARPLWMKAITEKLSKSNIVFLHAPSGEGKSTLAYRYLKENTPDIARFEVKHIADATHALRIARALGNHVRSLGLPVTVYLDIPPQHDGWIALIKELSFYREIRQLVTIREEDWRRASVSGADFTWEHLELDFDEQEAEVLYERLVERLHSPLFTCFDEAWQRFGGEGPLLEFIYLVTHGGKLRERLEQQIHVIEGEIKQGHRRRQELDLLRLVSVASSFSARLHIRPLLQMLDFPDSGNPLRLLEKEYLIRTSGDGFYVEGLHPVRSRVVADLLCDPISSAWGESASACIPLLDARSMESFLLGAFSEDDERASCLITTLSALEVSSWQQTAGIVRALLWLGVARYVRQNTELILHIEHELGLPWWISLDIDVAQVSGMTEPYCKNILPEEAWKKAEELRRRQSPKEEVFGPLRAWLAARTSIPDVPASDSEWASLAETLYWSAREGGSWPLLKWFPWAIATEAINNLTVETAASLVVALWETASEKQVMLQWLEQNESKLVDCFREQTLTPKVMLKEDGCIEAHFVVRLDLFPSPQSPEFEAFLEKSPLNAEAVYRVNLLRRLFPNRKRYACQGYGHAVIDEALPHDETQKCIDKYNLLLEWPVRLNATFRGLGDFILRPSTWDEYVSEILDRRNSVVGALEELTGVVESYFESKKYVSIIGKSLNTADWESRRKFINSTPMLPKCAVDKLGRVSEGNAKGFRQQESPAKAGDLSIDRFRSWKNALDEFTRTVNNFMEQAMPTIAVQSALGRGRDERKILSILELLNGAHGMAFSTVRLSLINLCDAFQALLPIQGGFRKLLVNRVDSESLSALEIRENEAFSKLWALWYELVEAPKHVIRNPALFCERKEHRLWEKFEKDFEKEIRRLVGASGCRARIITNGPRYEDSATVWILLDADELTITFTNFETVVGALRTSFLRQGSLERLKMLLQMKWSRIVVVPCSRNRTVLPTGWVLRPHSLYDSKDLPWWALYMQHIPQSFISELGLTKMDNSRLRVGFEFFQSFMEFVTTAVHIRELERIGETDDLGCRILQGYVSELQAERGGHYQQTLDSATTMVSAFNHLVESEQAVGEKLRECMEWMREWFEATRAPTESEDGSVSLTISEMSEWSRRLQDSTPHVVFAYLRWVDDVIENSDN